MIKMIMKKIKNKTWLTMCLLLGMSFLVATFSCQPMFKAGSLDKLLDNMFDGYIEDNNEYPTTIGRTGLHNVSDLSGIDALERTVSEYEKTWTGYLTEIGVLTGQSCFKFEEESCQGSCGSKGNYLSIGYIPNMLDHSAIVSGQDFYSYTQDEAYYPCVISESVMDEFGFVVGETLKFVHIEDSMGNNLELVIVGIFKEANQTDLFWYTEPNEYESHVFVSKETYDELINKYSFEKVTYTHNVLLDYDDIDNTNVDDLIYYINEFKQLDGNFTETFLSMLDEYQESKKTVDVILWVLELPIFGMVLAFIYMVSKQIIETEKNEIAMLKSRGINRKQIILMYGVQAGILSLAGFVVGIPLGYFLCKMAAGTTDFLTFATGNMGMYGFSPLMLLYGLIAVIIGVIFILIPVISSSGISIVEHKSSYSFTNRQFWEKYFLDIILLGLSIYFLYNFNKSKETMRADALSGNRMDPMIFLDSVLFIIAFGLVVLRITHYIVKLIYYIGRKKWKPATYASFLQITRTFGKQGFISVFLILTVAFGLFNANAARTINRNNEERIEYEIGADMVIHEKWQHKIHVISKELTEYEYLEPDFMKYSLLVDEGLLDSVTRVIYDDRTTVSKGNKTIHNVMLRGINTKEFGETAFLNDQLNSDVHWYTYLNEMASRQNGVVISKNLADVMELQVGDIIFATRYKAIPVNSKDARGSMGCYVSAIVDSWPGYDRYYYEEGEMKERYLIVANYATVVRNCKISPYEVWMNLAEGVTYEDVEKRIEAMPDTELTYEKVIAEDIADMKASPLIQITNGMYTMSFIIALVLCAVGFLIYWISSIKQRELLFGVYRAMGMSVKEVNKMLVNEHIFSTLFSIISGGLVGMITTVLFVGLFGIIYLPEKHNLDLYICFEVGDIVKLTAVIFAMILVCVLVLRRLIRSMDITQALKLGEE